MLDLLDLLHHGSRPDRRQLDADRDHKAIMRRAFRRDFAAEIRLGAALALFRVFAVPRLSAVLARTGAWLQGPATRLERTVELLTTLIEDGYDGPRGAAALARINAAHAGCAIANDDMLFVLTTFVVEPARIIERHGPRPLTPTERESACRFWREVGLRMGIRDIPTSFAAMDGLAREYEAMHRYGADSNRRVAAGALTAITRLVPAPLAGLGAQVVCALLEAPVREACGLPEAPRAVAWALGGVTAARRVIAAPS